MNQPDAWFRGCRLGIVYSEISEMQSRAVFEAAAIVQKEGVKVNPEVMIPLVASRKSWTCRSRWSTGLRPSHEGKRCKAELSGRTMMRFLAAR